MDFGMALTEMQNISYILCPWDTVWYELITLYDLCIVAADQTRAMQDQFAGNAAAMAQQDPNKAFKVSSNLLLLTVLPLQRQHLTKIFIWQQIDQITLHTKSVHRH